MKSKIEVAQSCPTLSNPMDCSLPGSSIHGIFQARVLEWGAISCVQLFAAALTIAHQAPLSMGILQARILEWVTYPFSRGSSQPRNLTGVSYIAGRFFTSWATREQVGIQPTSVPVCLNSQSSLFLIHALIQQVFTEHLLCVKGLFLELGR